MNFAFKDKEMRIFREDGAILSCLVRSDYNKVTALFRDNSRTWYEEQFVIATCENVKPHWKQVT